MMTKAKKMRMVVMRMAQIAHNTSQMRTMILAITNILMHRWELSVLHYHKVMVSNLYPILVVITLLFSWIKCINNCVCILTVSPG